MYQEYKKYFDLKKILATIKDYLTDFDEKRFIEAFEFAEKAHNGQYRKDGTTPYISHPVETVKILSSLRADEDTLISALLHDVPEDTPHDIHEIKEHFGDNVAFLVDGITKLSKVHYQHNMPERQIESLKKLLLHSAEDLRVVIIKLADRLHNMRTLENIDEDEKRLRIATETLEIYVPIANLLGIREIKTELEDLCFKFLFTEDYEKLNEKLHDVDKKNQTNIDEFMDIVRKELKKHDLKAKISLKKKNLYSIYKKIKSLGKNIDDVDDRVAIKIVTDTTPNCYQILGIIHLNFIPKTNRFKDYIANQKFNGYQSLHTTIFGVKGLLTEVQIKTKEMDIEAEYGIAAHFFDKEKFAKDMKRSSWLKLILEMEKTDNESDEFLSSLKSDTFQERIFVFTPKGEVVDLPKDASVIDFAYSLHTDLGDQAIKADVNGKIKAINTVLETGDVVKVITLPKNSPELSWLSFVKTNLAKNKITAFFKKESTEKKIKEGHKILQKEFDIAGLGVCERMSFKKIRTLLFQHLNKTFNNLDELFIAVAEGEVKASEVVKILDTFGESYMPNFMRITDYEKLKEGIKVDFIILAKDKFGLLKDVADIVYRYAVNMYFVKARSVPATNDAEISMQVLVNDLETVSHIFDELEQVDGVKSVYRFSRKRMYLFWSWSFLVSLLWISHPWILRYLHNSGFALKHPLITHFFVVSIVFILVFLVILLTNLRKKYFPMVRNKKGLWIVAFSIPLIAMITLGIELFFFKVQLGFLTLSLEILLIYLYLAISYNNYRKTMTKT